MPVVFGRVVRGFVIRGAGTATEQKFAVEFGGDLKHTALFQTADRPRRGDELECSYWDENRVITRVDANTNLSGGVSYWEAQIVPKSELEPPSAGIPLGINISGTGNRINIGSVDQSLQNFNTASLDTSAILSVLDEIAKELKTASCSEGELKDALLDLEQARIELRRSKPEPSRIWTAVEGLGVIAGIGEKLAKLAPLLAQIFP